MNVLLDIQDHAVNVVQMGILDSRQCQVDHVSNAHVITISTFHPLAAATERQEHVGYVSLV